MKWNRKNKPNKGDKRTIKCFAFLPTPIYDEKSYWVWLEFYYKEQVYSTGSGPGGFFSGWITNSKTLTNN